MEFLDYEVLRLIWWVLLGVIIIGFAAMDGFDMGVATLLPFVAKTDGERRVVINTVAPVWEGNQVWLILAGGAIFAAWPILYAVSFSGFYLAMFIILFALIIRPVSFKFRSKRPEQSWRNRWDMALCVSGLLPALIMGVAVGNTLQGVPFEFNKMLQVEYTGTLFGLLNPFGLMCGIMAVAMVCLHGASWIVFKAEGDQITQRAKKWGVVSGLLVVLLFALGGYLVADIIKGYVVTSDLDPNGPSNPLGKEVSLTDGAWLLNYTEYSWMLIAPVLGFVATALSVLLLKCGKGGMAFLASKLGIFGIISTVGLSMFPVILPSSTHPEQSLTVFDSSSSEGTMLIMLFVTLIFLPIVLFYTSWVYKVMWGKVTEEEIQQSQDAY